MKAWQTKESIESSGKNSRFDDACKEIQASVQKYIDSHSIEFQHDHNSDDDEDDLPEQAIIERVLKNYNSENEGVDGICRTSAHLQEAFRSDALICLICIDNIQRNDSIWSCRSCYSSFHLGCIQKWAKDSVFQQSQAFDANASNFDHNYSTQNHQHLDKKKSIEWACPKCRAGYQQTSIPSTYFCFCDKTSNPTFDPWLIPHSCGEKCKKELTPACGHLCLLLCHPGPCPPCPVMVKSKCYCGTAPVETRRCSTKNWSCNRVCAKFLACRQHKCQDKCHKNLCSTCLKLSDQRCQCGNKKIKRPCADPVWRCDKICDKKFPCKHHTCNVLCHAGSCGLCPESNERSCPCGKIKTTLPCTELVPTCGDSCSKPLLCGKHFCAERCHRGACPSCLQFSRKRCVCGLREKELPCSKPYTCEVKCKRTKDCTKHACNRKCCAGDCPPCEHPCNSTLKCGSHKCQSRCHPGRCYPCDITYDISCTCGYSKVKVPCGREQKTPKPKCSQDCKKKSLCHHSKQKVHKCHESACPSCKLQCNVTMSCKHICPEPCHDLVPIKITNRAKPATPWEVTGPQIEMKALPCPPCLVPIPTICLGKHETHQFPCHEARSYSCNRACGRKLTCTNDTCQKECHLVKGAPNALDQGTNCQPCQRQCSKPSGCSHMCTLKCHPGECPQCQETLKLRCHCGLLQLFVKCYAIAVASPEERIKMRSCKNVCIKQLPCNHRCQLNCHAGPCTPPTLCRKKVSLKCPCKRKKKDYLCKEVNCENGKVVECDLVCREKKEDQRKKADTEKLKREAEEEEQQKRELEEFERMIEGKRKKRQRRVTNEKKENERDWLHCPMVYITILVVSFAIAVYTMS